MEEQESKYESIDFKFREGKPDGGSHERSPEVYDGTCQYGDDFKSAVASDS